ncbi:MAG: hypothetical protein M3468_10555 [Acidobacteriota bacterium]|nr:hypothetical protein [Acidobacteriota bacterium]
MDQPPVRKPTAQDGGSVWALIGRDDAPDFPARWLSAYDPPNAGRAVAFGGDSTSDVLVAVLERESPWSDLPSRTPLACVT